MSSGFDPEELGIAAAWGLVEEMRWSGWIGTSIQSFGLSLMALSEKEVSKVVIGRISEHAIGTLRLIKEFFGVSFAIEGIGEEEESEEGMEEEKEEEEEGGSENESEGIEEEKDTKKTKIKKGLSEFSCLGSGYYNISKNTM